MHLLICNPSLIKLELDYKVLIFEFKSIKNDISPKVIRKKERVFSQNRGKEMSKMDLQLYAFLMDNLSSITDEWISQRSEKKGSIYSMDADKSIEISLREQNKITNITVASILLKDKEVFNKNKKDWALSTAKNRVASNTPIHEALEALGNLRKVYWRFVEKFVALNNDEVTRDDLLKWGIIIHSALDELKVDFSEMYYKITLSKLSDKRELIEELSSPVILITASIGILPLIGDIDTIRAKTVLEQIPKKCLEADITHLFIDLSGVSIIDTMVAHQMHDLIQVLRLLGVKSTITGIRPEIAQTTIQLGLNFAQVDSFNTLQLALKSKFTII